MGSVLRHLQQNTERFPDKLLFEFLDIDGRPRQSYTYAQFIQRTTDIASYLHRRLPMPPGARVLLAYSPGLEMICAFFACARLGLIPVPVCPRPSYARQAAPSRIDYIARDCGAGAVLTDESIVPSGKSMDCSDRTGSGMSAGLSWITSTDARPGAGVDFSEAHSDVLFLQYTSGSTSDPKGVMVTHDNILHNCGAVVDHLPVGVSWLPQYHDMGLIGYYLFFALKGGTTYGFSPTDFIKRPGLWLETISRHRGTASSAPNFAYEYCLRPGKIPSKTIENVDLSSLRFLMTASEPVRADVYRDFLNKFKPCGLNPRSFFAAYGLAENTLAVSNYGRTIRRFDRDALRRHVVKRADPCTDGTDSTPLVSCGRLLGDNEIRIVNVSGSPRQAGAGRIGEIWVRGPSKCRGYWNRPELTATVFRANLPGEDTGDTWLRTGDLGFLSDGELYVCGRSKDLIIVRGLNYYPQDIELLVAKDPAVQKDCVAAFNLDRDGRAELVVVAKVRDPKSLPDARGLQRRVLERLGVAIDVMVFIRGRGFTKTSSGKTARHLVRRQLEAGKLEIVSRLQLVSPIDSQAGHNTGRNHASSTGCNGFEAVLRKFSLSGRESWSFVDAGLDSVRLVELSLDLKTHLTTLGHEHLGEAVDLRVLQKLAIRELNDLLVALAAAAPGAEARFRRIWGDVRREQRLTEREMMRRDSQLGFSPSTLPARTSTTSAASEGVLLTGGTGFFGPFLLASVLKQTSDPVYVLVRANSESEGRQRVLAGLAPLSPTSPELKAWESRVRPVCGDLGQANLGLTVDHWHALADRVHTIFHNGAQVNYLLDYASMRGVNVGGTHELIRFAMSGREAVFNHISTTFVFGWSMKDVLYESDNNADMDLLDFGYSQSKWVSEQLVFAAMRQGLRARVFRPALITPSLDGRGCNLDISIRLLAFMLNHRIGTNAQNQVSFSPADLAADNIVAISQSSDSIGRTYHVTRDTYTNMVEVARTLGKLTKVKLTNFSLADFVPEVIERCKPGDILFPLLEFFVRSAPNITAMEFKRYDNRQYVLARDASRHGKADPPLRDVVLGILRYMRRQGVVSD